MMETPTIYQIALPAIIALTGVIGLHLAKAAGRRVDAAVSTVHEAMPREAAPPAMPEERERRIREFDNAVVFLGDKGVGKTHVLEFRAGSRGLAKGNYKSRSMASKAAKHPHEKHEPAS